MNRRVTVIGVPTSRASHTAGQERAPAVIRRAGLIGLLNARGFDVTDYGDLPVARFRPDRGSPRAQNSADVVRTVGDVEALVARALSAGTAPLVIGGDCTIALGAVAALVGAGRRPKLVYFDAHADMNVPDAVPYGALDWMGVAHALDLDGAVRELAAAGPRRPLLAPADVHLFATVPAQLTGFEAEAVDRLGIGMTPTGDVAADPAGAAARALAAARGDDGFWLHLDVDAIDSVDLPIADFYQHNNGLTFDDALAALAALAADPGCIGVSVAQFNPDHADEHGEDAERFTRGLVGALASSLDG